MQRRRGHLFECKLILESGPDGSGLTNTLTVMSPLVDTNDLIDARGVAEILGLAQPGNVSLYQRRHPDMPRPVVNLGQGRCMLWVRPEIEIWAADFEASGRSRPARRASN